MGAENIRDMMRYRLVPMAVPRIDSALVPTDRELTIQLPRLGDRGDIQTHDGSRPSAQKSFRAVVPSFARWVAARCDGTFHRPGTDHPCVSSRGAFAALDSLTYCERYSLTTS
jgi:hypothetical protein